MATPPVADFIWASSWAIWASIWAMDKSTSLLSNTISTSPFFTCCASCTPSLISRPPTDSKDTFTCSAVKMPSLRSVASTKASLPEYISKIPDKIIMPINIKVNFLAFSFFMSKPPIFRQNKTPVRYLDTTVNRLSSNPVSTGVFSTILSYMLPVVDASQAYKIFS